MADMKTYGLPRLALLIVILSCLFYTSNSVALAQEPTPTFTPPPAATPKSTATEPGAPTATATQAPPTGTYTPPSTLEPTETQTPDGTQTPDPTATATDTPEPTPTNTPVIGGVLRIDFTVDDTVTEGDRLRISAFLNRPTTCDVNVIFDNGTEFTPGSVSVTIPAGSMSVDFWIVATNDDLPEGSAETMIVLQGYGSGCETVYDTDHLTELVTVYDPSTRIEDGIEPGGNNKNYLPLISMGISLDGRGFVVGFVLIVLSSVVYVMRRK